MGEVPEVRRRVRWRLPARNGPEALVVTHSKPRPEGPRGVHLHLDDGRRVDGILQYGREVEGAWSWFVRYDDGGGVTRLDWFEEPRIWSVE